MKVCLITPSYPRHKGDVRGIFIKTLKENLENLGAEVFVIKPNEKYKSIINADGIALSLKKKPTTWLQLIPCMLGLYWEAIKKGKKFDIIHGNWIVSTIPCLILKKFYKKPAIVTIRGGDIYFVQKKLNLFFVQNRYHHP